MPVVLQVYPKKGLPQIAWRKRAGNSALKFLRIVSEKALQIREVPDPVRIGVGHHIKHHPFGGNSEADGMRSSTVEGVIIELGRIPVVEVGRAAAHPARKVCNSAADENLGRPPSGKRSAANTQSRIGSGRIDRFLALIVGYRFMVATNSDRIRERGRENVSFLYRNELPRGLSTELNVVQSVGGQVGCLVVHIRAEQTVLVRKSVVDTCCQKVLVDDLLSGKSEVTKIPIWRNDVLCLGHRIEDKVLGRICIYCDGMWPASVRVL